MFEEVGYPHSAHEMKESFPFPSFLIMTPDNILRNLFPLEGLSKDTVYTSPTHHLICSPDTSDQTPYGDKLTQEPCLLGMSPL